MFQNGKNIHMINSLNCWKTHPLVFWITCKFPLMEKKVLKAIQNTFATKFLLEPSTFKELVMLMKTCRHPEKDKLQGCRILKTLHFNHKPKNYVRDLLNRSDFAKPTEINIWRPIINTATDLILQTSKSRWTLSIEVLRNFIKQSQTSLIKLACQITSK